MAYYRTSADRKAEAARARQITEESSKGTSMYYTVLQSEQYVNNKLVKAGVIFSAVNVGVAVSLTQVDSNGANLVNQPYFYLQPEVARKYFSKPTKSFTDAMEQSFMVSEASYC